METTGGRLFSSYRMREIQLCNRIVVSPMGQYSADEQGRATDWHLVHLGHLAMSGAGLLLTEATAVEPEGRISRHDLGIWSDDQIGPLQRILEFCRRYGQTRLGIQLAHSGRKGSVTRSWEGQRPVSIEEGGWPLWSASAIPHSGRDTPVPLRRDDMKRVIKAFAEGARRAHQAGFDAVEVHAAHGYLLHSFLSPFGNQRDDDYGGSLEGRMRFVLEVFEAVRTAWPAHKPVGVRISATDWAEGGWSLADSIVLSTRLRELGCDYITASSGGVTSKQKVEVHPGYQASFSEAIRREAGVPTMAVGLITEAGQAEEILQSGKADFVALGRGMLFNPRWPWTAAMQNGGRVFYPKQYERCHPAMSQGDFLKLTPDSDERDSMVPTK